jgi:hypothetical protein
MALAACLCIMAAVTLIGAGALVISSVNLKAAANYEKQAQAFHIAEAGLQLAIATIRSDFTWRGEETSDPDLPEGGFDILGRAGGYAVSIYDATDDGQGVYDANIPGGFVRFVSEGVLEDSSQTLACFVELKPNPWSRAYSPYAAVLTIGADSGLVKGYNDAGTEDSDAMILTSSSDPPVVLLPAVNQEALKTFADYTFNTLGDTQFDNNLSGLASFWRDDPINTRPYVIHVSGNVNISDRQVYGIIFVEGTSVTLSGSAKVEGVIYAPNASSGVVISDAGSAAERSVKGQVIAGAGGVSDSGLGNSNVQLVEAYVDAFNNFGGSIVDVAVVPGSWKHF